MSGTERYDFTGRAWEFVYDVVDSELFLDNDADLIYSALVHRLNIVSFGDYLKRYIYKKASLKSDYEDVTIRDYQLIICEAFKENQTPPSFQPTTAKLGVLAKNWLTQQTVRRKVVFLLGFGLRMSVEDVNDFLTKALREPEINPKDPFEVMCWYCYKNGHNYLKFKKLWDVYSKTPPNSLDMSLLYGDYTIGARHAMRSIDDDAVLITHLSKLKTDENHLRIHVTAKKHFLSLYDEARDIVAEIYNSIENECCIPVALRSTVEKCEETNDAYIRKYDRTDITAGDIERVICAAVPKDRYGNMVPSKLSSLDRQFIGKRFSRHRIYEILSDERDVTRFELITLNFFVYSQKALEFQNAKQRYYQFYVSTNKLLENCYMGKMYIQNPYEGFLLMCMLSEDPLGTYADVWEKSYRSERVDHSDQ